MRWLGLLFGVALAFGCEEAPKSDPDDGVRFFDDTGTQAGDDTGTSGDDTGSDPDLDADGDGYPASADCDDNDPTAYPGAEEVCDAADNNCDGDVDEGLTETWYPDVDGDGYGASASPIEACDQPVGSTSDGSDCDDSDPDTNPDGVEVCDGVDNDCNGDTDGEDALGQSIFYADADGDGYGDELVTVEACWATEGFTDGAGGFDCDDVEPTVNPGA